MPLMNFVAQAFFALQELKSQPCTFEQMSETKQLLKQLEEESKYGIFLLGFWRKIAKMCGVPSADSCDEATIKKWVDAEIRYLSRYRRTRAKELLAHEEPVNDRERAIHFCAAIAVVDGN